MILVDANLFLYAYNAAADQHGAARAWLEEILSGSDPVGVAWSTLLAFLRISTNPRAFPYPLEIAEAVAIVSEWLTVPCLALIEPGERHWGILSRLLSTAQVRGPLVTDAHLAALAIEHGAVLCSTDRDFLRFPGLQWKNPLAEVGR